MVDESIIDKLGKLYQTNQPIDIEALILEYNITPWTPVNLKERIRDSISGKLNSPDPISTQSSPSKTKMMLKSGAVVDKRSGLTDIGHVLVDLGCSNDIYTSVLANVDISSSRNHFFIIQVIEYDDKTK